MVWVENGWEKSKPGLGVIRIRAQAVTKCPAISCSLAHLTEVPLAQGPILTMRSNALKKLRQDWVPISCNLIGWAPKAGG